LPVLPIADVRKIVRDPSTRRVVYAVLLKFLLLAGLWWVFVKDVTWTPSPDDVGKSFLSSVPNAASRPEVNAP
jgi:hypothetical protein